MAETELSLREKILETTRRLLFSDGFQAISMRKIAHKIGVSATSIYLHFENKDHLAHTLIEESVEELSTAIERSAASKVGPIDKFHAIVNSYVNFAMSNPEKYQMIYMLRPEAMARYPKEKFRKTRRGYALLESVILDAINEGMMEVSDTKVAAYSIWAQLHGIISVVQQQRLDSRIDRDLFIEESIEYIVQGFLVRTTIN